MRLVQRWNSGRKVKGKARLKTIAIVGAAVLALLLVGSVAVKATIVGHTHGQRIEKFHVLAPLEFPLRSAARHSQNERESGSLVG